MLGREEESALRHEAHDAVLLVLRKLALVATLLMLGLAYLGWMPKHKARRFVQAMIAFFFLGFLWRVGGWYLSP